MTFGWTFEYIDEFVTLPQLKQMSHFWEKSPPIHQMIAAYLGIGKSKTIGEEVVVAEDAMPDLLREFAQAGGVLPDLEGM
jgi:hypothetical protein